MKRLFVLPVLLLTLVTGKTAFSNTQQEDEFLLTCEMSGGSKTHFVLNPKTQKAKYLNSNDMEVGELTTNEHKYVLHFPEVKDKRYEMVIQVNRYSGKLDWEHGIPPFGSFNAKNIFRSGTCVKGKNKPQF
jgi:hypothetical protein